MDVKYYVVVSAGLSILAAILFHFWGSHVHPGATLLVMGLLVAGVGLGSSSGQPSPLNRFDRFISALALGLLFLAVGVGIVPFDGWDIVRVLVSAFVAIVAGFVLMTEPPFESRVYGRREKFCMVSATAVPVLGLAAVTSFAGSLPLQNVMALWVTLIGAPSLLVWFAAPSIPAERRQQPVPAKQAA